MYRLLGRKVILITLLIISVRAEAQVNALEFDAKFQRQPYHFGISFGYNQTRYKMFFSEEFIQHDSILFAESDAKPGLNLAMIANMRINKYLSLRILPGLTFAEKTLYFEFIEDSTLTQRVESTLGEIPIQLRIKSDAYKDMRVYALIGIKWGYDFASTANARNAEDIVKFKKTDFSYEYGMGFEFYFPQFIFSPEIRIIRGLQDVHSRDPDLQISEIFQEIRVRGFVVSIHLEG